MPPSSAPQEPWQRVYWGGGAAPAPTGPPQEPGLSHPYWGVGTLGGGAALAPPQEPAQPYPFWGVGSNAAPARLGSRLTTETATVRFHLRYRTHFGQGVKLVGSHPKLGGSATRGGHQTDHRSHTALAPPPGPPSPRPTPFSAGDWNLKTAVDMRWSPGDLWVATVQLPAGFVYEYKYVLVDYSSKTALEWQAGSNAVLAVVVSETDVSVFDNW